MKKPILLLVSLLLISSPAKAYSGAEIALGVIGGIILGGVITQHQHQPPPVYYPVVPPVGGAIYYPPAPGVYYRPPPMPCYNRPVPVLDAWGRQIGWQEIRVCQ